MNLKVNYDAVAPTYNRRYADGHDLKGVAAALGELARGLNAGAILEVGCGTARWLADLRPATDALFGLDFSAGMLAQARRRDGRLSLTRGNASRLPYPDGAFDLVYCVHALHHFDRKADFIREARRLLREGGALAVIGSSPRDTRTRWYIYDYFDGTYDADLARFPSWGTVLDWMGEAGFERAEWRLVEQIHDDKFGRAVLDDPFLDKNATSQLTLLSDKAYAAGLQRIHADLERAEANGETLLFPSTLRIEMLVGWV